MRFPIFCEDGSNIYDNVTYVALPGRIYGNQPNTSADSKLMNSFMKSASVVLDEIAQYATDSTSNVGPETSSINLQIPVCKTAGFSGEIGFEFGVKPYDFYAHIQVFLKANILNSNLPVIGAGLTLSINGSQDSVLGNINTSIPQGDVFSFDWMIDIYVINGQIRILDRASNTYNNVESVKQGYFFTGYNQPDTLSVKIVGFNTQETTFDFDVVALSNDKQFAVSALEPEE